MEYRYYVVYRQNKVKSVLTSAGMSYFQTDLLSIYQILLHSAVN